MACSNLKVKNENYLHKSYKNSNVRPIRCEKYFAVFLMILITEFSVRYFALGVISLESIIWKLIPRFCNLCEICLHPASLALCFYLSLVVFSLISSLFRTGMIITLDETRCRYSPPYCDSFFSPFSKSRCVSLLARKKNSGSHHDR